MKAYTDISQSKRLAEILPLESADGYWDFQIDGYKLIVDELGYYKNDSEIPCWSLAALINIMPKIEGDKPIIYLSDNDDNYVSYSHIGINAQASNLVDACYEIIIKLHEQKYL